jgi:hypothetical protein
VIKKKGMPAWMTHMSINFLLMKLVEHANKNTEEYGDPLGQ